MVLVIIPERSVGGGEEGKSGIRIMVRERSDGNRIIFSSPLHPVHWVVALKGALNSGSVNLVVGRVAAESATRSPFSPRQAVLL